MGNRLDLHETLCAIINITEPDGDRHVYYNPPEAIRMKYPAIRYISKPPNTAYANNALYRSKKAYELVLIEVGSDSEYADEIEKLPYCKIDRFYKANNLNHTVFTIYN